ncbi:MAG: hypothetical protein AAF569_07210, partial [Pseudomonadota bacterium]
TKSTRRLRRVRIAEERFEGGIIRFRKNLRTSYPDEASPSRVHYDSVAGEQLNYMRLGWDGTMSLDQTAKAIEQRTGVKYVVLGERPKAPAA